MQLVPESHTPLHGRRCLKSVLIRISLVLFLFVQTLLISQPVPTSPENLGTAIPDSIPEYLSIMAVGDVMLGTNYPSAAYLPPDDGKGLLAPVADLIRSADLSFANLEGVLLSAKGYPKKCGNPYRCYAFKSPDHYIRHFQDVGFDFVSLANNHSNDFGEPGRKNTVRLLDEAGIHHAGLLERPSVIFDFKGLKIGFCAFAPNRATVKLNDHKGMREMVRKLKSQADIVIVSFHGGGEGKKYQHVTRKTERFLGENRGNPYKFARDAIDAGADLVIGHGPHVPRAVDLYKDRMIAYSLGNFATYSRFNLSGANGLAPMLEVRIDRYGVFQSARIFSAIQRGEGGPVLDADGGAARKIAELTAKDFPQGPLEVSADGAITRRTSK